MSYSALLFVMDVKLEEIVIKSSNTSCSVVVAVSPHHTGEVDEVL